MLLVKSPFLLIKSGHFSSKVSLEGAGMWNMQRGNFKMNHFEKSVISSYICVNAVIVEAVLRQREASQLRPHFLEEIKFS